MVSSAVRPVKIVMEKAYAKREIPDGAAGQKDRA